MSHKHVYSFSYRDNPNIQEIEAMGGTIKYISKYTNVVTAFMPEEQNIEKLKANPNLLHIEENYNISLPGYQIDKVVAASPRMTAQRANIGQKQVFPWNIRRVLGGNRINSGNGIKIGIIDTGIQLNHPDLAANIKGGTNIINPKASPNDDNGHGTHVAGIISAINNRIGVVGIADAASLYAIKVLDSRGSGTLLNLIKGIEWGIAKGMHVLNISISGGQSFNHALHTIIEAATRKGIIIVAAAGNTGSASGTEDSVQVPARIKPVLAVAALNDNNQRDKYSATGASVDIAAPGSRILSTYIRNSYAYLSGTSMAAAHVTGVIAIYRKRYSKLGVRQLCAMVKKRATKLGRKRSNHHTGWGLVKAR